MKDLRCLLGFHSFIAHHIEGDHGTRIVPDEALAPDDHAGDPTAEASTRHTS